MADNLSKLGWSWGCVSAVDRDGQTIFIAVPHPLPSRSSLNPLQARRAHEFFPHAFVSMPSLRRLAARVLLSQPLRE